MPANIRLTQILLKRGNTAASSTYTGPIGEIVIDTDFQALRIQDGVTAGGHLLYSSNIDIPGINLNLATLSSSVASLTANAATQQTQIAGLQDSIDSIVIPTLPTVVSAFTNDSDYATASYVSSAIGTAISNLVNSAPASLDTLGELATALQNNQGNVSVLLNGQAWGNIQITDLWSNSATQQTQITNLQSSLASLVIPTVPTNVSAFTNDSGYITNSSLSGYATHTEVSTAIANLVNGAPTVLDTLGEIATALQSNETATGALVNSQAWANVQLGNLWANSATQQTQINNLQSSLSGLVIPTVPSNVSAFTNDSGYITNSALSGYALLTDIPVVPTDLSSFTNNAGFITLSDVPATYTNANVADYLANYDGVINFTSSPAIISGIGTITTANLVFGDGTYQTTASLGSAGSADRLVSGDSILLLSSNGDLTFPKSSTVTEASTTISQSGDTLQVSDLQTYGTPTWGNPTIGADYVTTTGWDYIGFSDETLYNNLVAVLGTPTNGVYPASWSDGSTLSSGFVFIQFTGGTNFQFTTVVDAGNGANTPQPGTWYFPVTIGGGTTTVVDLSVTTGTSTWTFGHSGNLTLPGSQSPLVDGGYIFNVKGIVGLTASSGANISGFNTVDSLIFKGYEYLYPNGVSILDGIGGATYSNVDANALFTITSISAFNDVDTISTPPSVGEVLKWNGTHWAPGVDATTGGAGTEADTLDGQHGDYYLNYDNFSNVPDLSVYATNTSLNSVEANIGSFYTWANAHYELLSSTEVMYSDSNVATYLTTHNIAPQIHSDYAETNTANIAYIKNKPDLSVYATNTALQTLNANVGAYETWSNLNTAGLSSSITTLQTQVYTNTNTAAYLASQSISAQLQSDWNQATTGNVTYIKNKPTNVSAFTNDAGYLTGTSLGSVTTIVQTANVSYYPNVTATTTNATFYPGLYNAQSGNLATYTNSGLTYNPSSGNLATTGNLITTGDAYIAGGRLRTTATTANVFNTGATTVNMAGGATIGTYIGNAAGVTQLYGNVQGSTNGFAIGYRDIPQVSFAGNTTIQVSDAGKHYYSTQSTNYTLTVANNATQSFSVGAAVNLINQGTGTITVAPGSGVTMYMAGNSTSSTRTVASYGMATLQKVATDTWFITGVGLS